MKKIKYFLMLLLGVVLSVSVISCSKEDDDDAKSGPYADSPLLGNWEYDDGFDTRTYTFKADGTFTLKKASKDNHKDPVIESGTFQTDNKSVLRLVTTQAEPFYLGSDDVSIEIVENVYIKIDYKKYYKK